MFLVEYHSDEASSFPCGIHSSIQKASHLELAARFVLSHIEPNGISGCREEADMRLRMPKLHLLEKHAVESVRLPGQKALSGSDNVMRNGVGYVHTSDGQGHFILSDVGLPCGNEEGIFDFWCNLLSCDKLGARLVELTPLVSCPLDE